MKTTVWVGIVMAVGGLVTGVLVIGRHGAQHPAVPQAKAELAPVFEGSRSQPQNAAPPTMAEPLASSGKPGQLEHTSPSSAKPDAPSIIKAPPLASGPNSAAGSSEKDPLARTALSLVGADPAAEAYWIEAINDPRLSAEERQNLIEDLNEDGLSDTKLPTMDDLPLIVNRLRLIEELAPDAMDDVNFDAFKEAYKDLLNLAGVAMGGGEPVN